MVSNGESVDTRSKNSVTLFTKLVPTEEYKIYHDYNLYGGADQKAKKKSKIS